MKSILQLRKEREAITPIRRLLKKQEFVYFTGVNTKTPVKLAEEILDQLDVDWNNPALKFLDVKCNTGVFVLLLVERLLANGHGRSEEHTSELQSH